MRGQGQGPTPSRSQAPPVGVPSTPTTSELALRLPLPGTCKIVLSNQFLRSGEGWFKINSPHPPPPRSSGKRHRLPLPGKRPPAAAAAILAKTPHRGGGVPTGLLCPVDHRALRELGPSSPTETQERGGGCQGAERGCDCSPSPSPQPGPLNEEVKGGRDQPGPQGWAEREPGLL